MSLVKISKVDLSLFFCRWRSRTVRTHSFTRVSLARNNRRDTDIQANSINYSGILLSFSLSFVRTRGDSSARSRSIDNGGSDRDFESTVCFLWFTTRRSVGVTQWPINWQRRGSETLSRRELSKNLNSIIPWCDLALGVRTLRLVYLFVLHLERCLAFQ